MNSITRTGACTCRRRRKTCALRMRQGLPTNARRRATRRLPTTTSGSSLNSATAGASSPAGITFNGYSSGETLEVRPTAMDGRQVLPDPRGPCPDLPDPVRADRSRRDGYASRAPRADWGCVMADPRWRRPRPRVAARGRGLRKQFRSITLRNHTYQNLAEIQRRRLRLRHGLSEYQAALVAGLLFGEGRR